MEKLRELLAARDINAILAHMEPVVREIGRGRHDVECEARMGMLRALVLESGEDGRAFTHPEPYFYMMSKARGKAKDFLRNEQRYVEYDATNEIHHAECTHIIYDDIIGLCGGDEFLKQVVNARLQGYCDEEISRMTNVHACTIQRARAKLYEQYKG